MHERAQTTGESGGFAFGDERFGERGNGDGWYGYGPQNFSDGTADYTSLAVDSAEFVYDRLTPPMWIGASSTISN
jgi:hypothetical protein